MRWAEPILHVDMDAFFVEVERRRTPDLLGRPVAVGGTGPRSVVAAASYEARRFGVGSAMPMARALRQCPELVVVPPDHALYQSVSEEVFSVFRSFTPRVEGLSLDEAFLDVTGLRRHYTSPVEVGHAIRAEIRDRLDLPASVGVASSKFLAKLASEEAKPDGLHHVAAEVQLGFLHALPVRRLWGVGEATHATLEQLGAETVGDIAAVPLPVLTRRLGEAHGRHLHELAQGRDLRPVVSDNSAKSISVEETYPVDLTGDEPVMAELLAHSDSLASRLRRAGLAAGTITLKVRYGDFTTVSRSESVAGALDVARDIFSVVRRLVERVDLTRPVRLLGVGATNLRPADEARQLETGSAAEWDRLAEAVDTIRGRFGYSSIEPARLSRRRSK